MKKNKTALALLSLTLSMVIAPADISNLKRLSVKITRPKLETKNGMVSFGAVLVKSSLSSVFAEKGILWPKQLVLPHQSSPGKKLTVNLWFCFINIFP